ncbi:MAG: protein-methionine-sulfoxide reductase catalytic subunit MsrP [Alphaproteobacteria bacterium]
MLIKRVRGWELKENTVTPEHIFADRRRLVKALAAGPILAGGFSSLVTKTSAKAASNDERAVWDSLYPVKRNPTYKIDRQETPESVATTYNNFYEFGSHKEISAAAQKMKVYPWTVKIDGLVEKAMTVDFDALVKKMPLEERVYRHRCVEAWSIRIPYSGFPLKALVDYAKPLGAAKYLVMTTVADGASMPGLREFWYPWPYTDGLTLAEATNELAFIATGLYGKPIGKQNGAPLRLAVPWKYGFKHVKSIVAFTFTDKQPVSFWENLAKNEYGFWANINPNVPHPRWSQETERDLATNTRIPTQLYNGYGEFVAALYANMPQDRNLFM